MTVVVLVGEFVYLATENGIAANWGSIIFPSFFAGFLAQRMLGGDKTRNFLITAAALVAAVKLALMFAQVSGITVPAMAISAVLYYFAAYLFMILGRKAAKSGKGK